MFKKAVTWKKRTIQIEITKHRENEQRNYSIRKINWGSWQRINRSRQIKHRTLSKKRKITFWKTIITKNKTIRNKKETIIILA